MKLDEMKNDVGDFVPMSLDPSVPRCPKLIPIYTEDGVCIGEKCAHIDLHTMPHAEEIEYKPADNLSDPQVYAKVILQNDNVNVESSPKTDAFHAFQTIENLKNNE